MEKEELKAKLENLVLIIRQLLYTHKWDNRKDEHSKLWAEMVQTAQKLHKIVNPKHHKYMIENRGCNPDDEEFYNHIHPVEDLLAYMNDPSANDDPEDQTLNKDFVLKIFTRRWGHDDTYQIKRIYSGWEIGNIGISGICDKSGTPYLYENLNHDSVNFPESLPDYLEWLWEQAAEQGLTHEKVQEALNQLGEWISVCEKSSPKEIWEAYK